MGSNEASSAETGTEGRAPSALVYAEPASLVPAEAWPLMGGVQAERACLPRACPERSCKPNVRAEGGCHVLQKGVKGEAGSYLLFWRGQNGGGGLCQNPFGVWTRKKIKILERNSPPAFAK